MGIIGLLYSAVAATAFWMPVNVTQFFIEPEQPVTLEFRAETPDIAATSYRILDTDGQTVSEGNGFLKDKILQVTIQVPQGYFELDFPTTGQCFGIVSQTAYRSFEPETSENSRPLDSFFAIDAALSWLVQDYTVREELIKIGRRIGMCMFRERVSWSQIESKQDHFNWDASQYETLRKTYQKYEMPILELFHNAPDWTEKLEKYPANLLLTAKSWDEIRARWNSSWGALEVWNEPDISFGGNLPADQYVPLLKTLSWQFAVSKEKTPLIGGVIALYQDQWMKTAAKSGILDYCDIFSYHTYCRAPEFAACTKKYIQWLADNNQAGKPLWLTECGRPWKKGTDRPDREADKISAIDIVMKGVEAKACGVDRYFPFVYPYYEERDSNFGMCDKNNTPLHALAAYAQMIRVLSNQKYIGDYAAKPEGVDVARVFQGEDKKWIVFYTASPGKDCFISLPFTPVNVERITGEQIACEQGKSIDFSEGFLYVEVPADQPVELQQDSEIAKMHYLREKARNTETVPLRKVSPLVLRYDRDQASTSFNSSGYQITRLSGNEFSVNLTLFNLSDEKKTVPVTYQVNHEKIILKAPQSVTVPPQDKISFPMTLDISSVSEITPLELTITAEDTIHLLFTRETQFEQLPDIVSETTQIDLSPEDRWVKNKPGYCNADFLAPSERDSDSQWGMKFTFSGNGDRWAYPIYTVPRDFTSEYLTRSVYKGDAQNPSSEFSPAHYDGFALRVKATANDPEKTTIRLFTYDEERKSYYYTPGGITKADGNWHFIIVPFDRLSPFTNTPAAFDPDKIHYISVGGNTGETSFTVEVSHFYLYKK